MVIKLGSVALRRSLAILAGALVSMGSPGFAPGAHTQNLGYEQANALHDLQYAVAPQVKDTGEAITAGALNCQYPYVCLYNFDYVMVEKFKVVTSGWQTFSRRDVARAVNTRNDDVAYILHTNGVVECLPAGSPNDVYVFTLGVPSAIRISSAPTC
jgi:hypothetical protein